MQCQLLRISIHADCEENRARCIPQPVGPFLFPQGPLLLNIQGLSASPQVGDLRYLLFGKVMLSQDHICELQWLCLPVNSTIFYHNVADSKRQA